MPIRLAWSEIGVRLLCTLVAGFVIGLNRGEHGRPAGLRTTMLVSLAASVAMILSNALLATAGRPEDSFITLDLMRLPLGILTGMGFIGAGAIMRRDNLVLGVTTAATLWFVTILGLCFGAGQIWLGLAASLLAVAIVSGLKRLEQSVKQDRQATLAVVAGEDGPSEDDIRSSFAAAGYKINSYSIVYEPIGKNREVTCSVQWRALPSETEVPGAVTALANRSGIVKVAWTPQSQ
jgi:putative Mg2+ transporter-C (MgtC) family protein